MLGCLFFTNKVVDQTKGSSSLALLNQFISIVPRYTLVELTERSAAVNAA